jgi:hypothetical protein
MAHHRAESGCSFAVTTAPDGSPPRKTSLTKKNFPALGTSMI